jgi:hypothetical protein
MGSGIWKRTGACPARNEAKKEKEETTRTSTINPDIPVNRIIPLLIPIKRHHGIKNKQTQQC